MSEMNTSQLLLALDEQRQQLAANLSQKGVAASSNEGLETLVPKILDIVGGGGGNGSSENIYLNYDQLIPSDNYVKKTFSGSGQSEFDFSEFNINWDKVKYILAVGNNSGQSTNYGMAIAVPFVLQDNMYFKTDKTLEEIKNQYASAGWVNIYPIFWTTFNNTFYPRNGSDPSQNYRVRFNCFVSKPSTGQLLHRQLYQLLTSSGMSSVSDSIYPTFISIGWDD